MNIKNRKITDLIDLNIANLLSTQEKMITTIMNALVEILASELTLLPSSTLQDLKDSCDDKKYLHLNSLISSTKELPGSVLTITWEVHNPNGDPGRYDKVLKENSHLLLKDFLIGNPSGTYKVFTFEDIRLPELILFLEKFTITKDRNFKRIKKLKELHDLVTCQRVPATIKCSDGQEWEVIPNKHIIKGYPPVIKDENKYIKAMEKLLSSCIKFKNEIST